MYLLHPGAGLHGHEYSSPTETPNPRPGSPRIVLNRAPYSDPARPVSFQDTSRPSSIRTPGRLSSSRRRTLNDRVSFLDPDIDAMGYDGRPYVHSDGREAPPGRPRRRTSYRHTNTSYYLAHPAPTLTQKQRLLHIRPKLLLQLQRLSVDSRPMPTIDVISSTTFVPRLAKKFPTMYRGTKELGINDVIIARSDDYDALEERELEAVMEDTTPDKEILAVICQAPKDDPWTTEICLDDGSRWNAGPVAKGVLEMVKTDPITGEKTIARWVPRGTSRRNSLQTPRGAAESLSDQRYQFSFIDPNTRRHPILATLTQGTLKTSDTYSPISNPEEDHDCISSARTSTDGDHLDDETNTVRRIFTVKEEQRLLIEVSAIWVALRQGWCPSFRYQDASPTASSKSSTPPSSSKTERRTFSLTSSGAVRHRRNRSDTVTSIPESIVSSSDTLKSRPSIFARASLNANTFQYESDEPAPKRSVSTGTAFMRKAAARRANKPPSARTSESESGSRPPSPKRSVSVDIADDVRLSDLLPPSPVPQYQSSSKPNSPTNMRRSLSVYDTLKTGLETGPNKSHLQMGGPTESRVPGLSDSERLAAAPRAPIRSSKSSEKTKRGKWSCLIRLFKRHHHSKRS